MLIKALTLLAIALNTAQANTESVPENQLKVALTYNFSRYTEWPETANSEHFNFCILNNTNLATALKKVVGRKTANKEIIVLDNPSGDQLGNCQLIFFGGRDRKYIANILDSIKNKPILTIGELPDFIDNGGIIYLYKKSDKLRFEINPAQAQRSQLKISAQLLQLATITGN